MGQRRAHGSDRVFAVLGGPDDNTEIDLQQVMTWPSEEVLRQRLTSGLPLTSKKVEIGERGVPQYVGVRLDLGSEEAWLVRLGMDRPLAPFAAGMRLMFLQSTFEGSGAAMVWRLRPRPDRQGELQQTKIGLALVISA